METDLTKDLVVAANTTNIAVWSETKKKDFVETFKQRIGRSLVILYEIAQELETIALKRKYISGKHQRGIKRYNYDYRKYGSHDYGYGSVNSEISRIAKEKVGMILENLPSLKKALQVIDTETVKLLEEQEESQTKLEALKEKLDDLSEPVDMALLDQKMTIAQFRKYIETLAANKDKIIAEITALGRKLQSVTDSINTRLYAGIPGISEAVIKVINDYYERMPAMEQMERRISETVMFGDSPEAIEILKHFEQDEVILAGNIKQEFDKALAVLKVSKKSIGTTKKVKK